MWEEAEETGEASLSVGIDGFRSGEVASSGVSGEEGWRRREGGSMGEWKNEEEMGIMSVD